MVRLTLAVVAAAFLVFPRPFEAAVGGLLEALGQMLEGLRAAVHAAMTAAARWLKSEGAKTPRAILGGVIVACAGVFVARSEYAVLAASLAIVWPDHINSGLVALSVVLVTFAVGLLLHAWESRWARIVLGVLAAVLIGTQATLAFARTRDIEKTQILARVAEAVTAPAADDGLVINGRIDSTELEGDKSKPAAALPNPELLPCVLAAVVASLLSLGGVVMGWGAFSLAHTGLAWLFALPVLTGLALGNLVVTLAAALPGPLRRGLALLTAVWADFCAGVARLVRRALPSSWCADAHEWSRAQHARQIEAAQSAREHAFLLAELEKDLRSAAEMAETSRRLVREHHEEASREALRVIAEKRRDIIVEACTELMERVRQRVLKNPIRSVLMLFWPLDYYRRFPEEPTERTLPPPAGD